MGVRLFCIIREYKSIFSSLLLIKRAGSLSFKRIAKIFGYFNFVPEISYMLSFSTAGASLAPVESRLGAREGTDVSS